MHTVLFDMTKLIWNLWC